MRASVLALTLSIVTLAPAALAGGGFEVTEHGYYIFDFLAYCVIMWALLNKPLSSFLAKRRSDAAAEMEEASAVKATATERLEELEAKLSRLDDEVASIEEQFRLDGQREHDRILAEADSQAEKTRREAKLTISRENAQLKTEISSELAERAMARAEQIIQERLDSKTQQALIRSFIDDLEKRTSLDSISA